MPPFGTRYDRLIADIIYQAQSYSNPIDQTPSPPSRPPVSVAGPDGTADVLEGRGRSPRPPWFEPINHPDDREPSPADNSDEVPIVLDGGEVPEPGGDDKGNIEAYGIDALAYYAPFHFYRRNHWGVYIRDYGIAYLATRFLGRRSILRADNWVVRCAHWFLAEHEYFHFQTEIAATNYEFLTRDLRAYEKLFHDGNATWFEEGMANARAHRHLKDHEDDELTLARLDHFRGFASSWMKSQPPGYRDFDRWCRSTKTMQKGQEAITKRLHEVSASTRHPSLNLDLDILRLFNNAEYSRVPLVRIPDSGIPWLKWAKFFPKAHGLRVFVYTREHPPAHIHVEFLDGSKSVRLEWPSLRPLNGEPSISRSEESDIQTYLKLYQSDILEKLKAVFRQSTLQPAV